MPQDQNAQPGPQEGSNPPPQTPPPAEIPVKPEAGGADLSKILLPKKPLSEGTPASGVRINAGILVDQEQRATLPLPPKPAPLATPKKDEATVQALETYQGDIEKLVQDKNMSVVSIAAAEAGRRETAAPPAKTSLQDLRPRIIKSIMVVAGVLLLIAAGAAIIYVTKPAPAVNISTASTPTPFINVDSTLAFIVPPGVKRGAAMNALQAQRQNISLSLGLIARLYLALSLDPTTQKLTPLSAEQLLTILAPNAPASLLRAVEGKPYILGIHSVTGNQPFVILQTDSYEQAFSGMLQWEQYMAQDLSPFFSNPPHVYINEENGTSTSQEPVFVRTGFVDRIVENQDTRALEDSRNTILLLWSFVNRNTLVITTNESTLREIVGRLKNAPIVPLP